jgi:hypothetical protein
MPEIINDDAIRFTLSYFEVIERNLEIVYSSQGEPICVPSKITAVVISNLMRDLQALLCGEKSRDAIAVCKIYGENHIQSIGFGHVSDFDAFIKIGFLYSERVVIWDILSSRILRLDNITETSTGIIADIACNLLLLRPAVKLGGVVVLPHPLMWSESARNISAEFSSAQERSSAALGLLFAMVAISEGLPLHPYTLTTREPASADHDASKNANNYSRATCEFTFGMASLMGGEFCFLRTIRIDDFYKIINRHSDLNRALRKQFASLSGLSPLQSRKEMDGISAELKKLSADRDKSIANYWLDGALASAGVVTGALTMTASPAGATLFAILGLSPTAATAVRRLLAQPAKNVIVQAFSDLRAARPFSLEIVTEISDAGELWGGQIDLDLAAHITAIETAPWTENAHQYLEGLEEGTATAVLNALRPEQMYNLVNYRFRQEDYIGDYLEFVWHSSPNAFWRHIEQSFMSDEGMVMYDDDKVHRVLISEDMPLTVWMTLLEYIPSVYRDVLGNNTSNMGKEETGRYVVEYQVDQLTEVIAHQLLESVQRAEKQEVFRIWLSNLNTDDRSTVNILMLEVFPSGLPNWIC